MTEDILLSWSGGKDSTLAFHEIAQKGKYRVHSLLTTLTEGYDRISMHGVRKNCLNSKPIPLICRCKS